MIVVNPMIDFQFLKKNIDNMKNKKFDLRNTIFGPGDDNYGRDVSPLKMEVCVDCGKITNVPISMPVDFRENYVDGSGQLCSDCYNKLYNKLP
jgi:hypothetical protein